MVSFAYGDLRKPRLLMMQFEGESGVFVEKLITTGTHVERVTIDSRRGYFLRGAPHELHFLARDSDEDPATRRLAGSTRL